MKKTTFFAAALLLAAILCPNLTHAQKQNVWKGGTPGHATDWNCPRNWSLGFVPDWTCVAIVRASQAETPWYPVIDRVAEAVQALQVCAGARLEIGPAGRLEVEVPEACFIQGELRTGGALLADNQPFLIDPAVAHANQ